MTKRSFGSALIFLGTTSFIGGCGNGGGELSLDSLAQHLSAVPILSTGNNHSCVVVEDGTARCWGSSGPALGNGSNSGSAIPVVVNGLSNVRALSAGYAHTCAIADGGAYCWGAGGTGRLGNGSSVPQLVPTPVFGLSDAVQITAGYDHSCAIRGNRTVVCWGYNSGGALGSGTSMQYSLVPVPVVDSHGLPLQDAIAIGAGSSFACALQTGGRIACWGVGGNGRLGNGSTNNSNVALPVLAYAGHELTEMVSLSVGSAHVCSVHAGGSASCWGRNSNGQLGTGTSTDSVWPIKVAGFNHVDSISAGDGHSCAIGASEMNPGGEHDAYCWGYGYYGSLGNGCLHSTSCSQITQVPVTGMSDAAVIEVGGWNSCAVVGDSIKCWGLGTGGQLGNNRYQSFGTPQSVAL